uniref:Uncharacterized protein n=1 Tax=Setaria digitata TaxID=48799 RepID=A0A915PIE3_9BILA
MGRRASEEETNCLVTGNLNANFRQTSDSITQKHHVTVRFKERWLTILELRREVSRYKEA